MTTTRTEEAAGERKTFEPKLGVLGALIAMALAFVLGMGWPEVLIGIGLGFVIGGAARLFAGIWQYLAVFFALVGGFVWLLIHYIK